MTGKLDYLLYLDEKSFEMLYDLYYENITEMTLEKNRNHKNKLGIKAVFSNYLPVNLNINGDVEIDKNKIERIKTEPVLGSKINDILNKKFNMTPIILRNLIENMQENGVYYFQGTFELQSIESEDGKDLIKSRKYINNRNGLIWKLKLVGLNDKNINVNMVLGGDKILVNHRHLTYEIEECKQFIFNILGKVTKFNEKNFSIKPIVVFYL